VVQPKWARGGANVAVCFDSADLGNVSPDQIIDLLRPYFRTLATPQTPPPADQPPVTG